MGDQEQIVIKKYTGGQEEATRAFQEDAPKMADRGYYPTSQTWTPGAYGCGAFLMATLLCFILIGIIVFIYMLIVKPPGTLTVTYELRSSSTNPENSTLLEEKVCPTCAETIKLRALKCRFCGEVFSEDEVAVHVAKLSEVANTRVACEDGNCTGIIGGDDKCGKCGKKPGEKKDSIFVYCPDCKERNRRKDFFCDRCGYKLK